MNIKKIMLLAVGAVVALDIAVFAMTPSYTPPRTFTQTELVADLERNVAINHMYAQLFSFVPTASYYFNGRADGLAEFEAYLKLPPQKDQQSSQ